MFAKEEAKKIRERFWEEFRQWSGNKRRRSGKPARWIMNDTGIKQLKLKFHFDSKNALAGIEIDTRNIEKRLELWSKLENTKTILEKSAKCQLTWDLEFPLEGTKTVSRIYSMIENVDIYEPTCWNQVKEFFYEKMSLIEEYFIEYKDYLKYGS
jgi:hypothetical protein